MNEWIAIVSVDNGRWSNFEFAQIGHHYNIGVITNENGKRIEPKYSIGVCVSRLKPG